MAEKFSNILNKIDWQIIIIYLFLVFAGWINIYSAVFDENASSIFDTSQKYGKQLIWIGAAFLLAFLILIINSNVFYGISYPFYILIIIVLIGVFLFAPEIKGARSWIELGTFRIQPSEFAKLATALAVSKYLGGYDKKINRLSDASKTSLFLVIPIVLIILQGDTGSAMVFASFFLAFYREGFPLSIILCFLAIAVIFIASILWGSPIISVIILCSCIIAFLIFGIQKKHKIPIKYLIIHTLILLFPLFLHYIFELKVSLFVLILISLLAVIPTLILYSYRKKTRTLIFIFGICFGGILVAQSEDYIFNNVLGDHQQKRINVFLGLGKDPNGSEFNLIQSKIAIGSGDLTGKGFLNGTQTKNDFVPEQSTDFIFCTIGEEWGFIGAVTIIFIFVYLILRIMRNAERQRTKFSRIYGYCVASILFFHLVINIGMTIGFMPVIGIPLPFFSYGGSSLWGFTILLFIFIKLDANREELIQ